MDVSEASDARDRSSGRARSQSCGTKGAHQETEGLRDRAEALRDDIIDALQAQLHHQRRRRRRARIRLRPTTKGARSDRFDKSSRHRQGGGHHRDQHRRATSATNRQHQQEGPRQVLERDGGDLDRHRRRGDRRRTPRDFLIAVSARCSTRCALTGAQTAAGILRPSRSANGCGSAQGPAAFSGRSKYPKTSIFFSAF